MTPAHDGTRPPQPVALAGGEPRVGAPRVVRAVIWLPGLAVALGAAVATAHGLFQVALAARVPGPIAWLYPLITDGLALVAYGATARLQGSAARYAWSVVVLAAGLSGLAQAAYLAADSTLDAAPVLRFGIGAWPAVAAAIVAHLLYLLIDAPLLPHPGPPTPAHSCTDSRPASAGSSQPDSWTDSQTYSAPALSASPHLGNGVPATPAGAPLPVSGSAPDPVSGSVSGALSAAVAERADTVSGSVTDRVTARVRPAQVPSRVAPPSSPPGHDPTGGRAPAAPTTARERARAAAAGHAARQGALPTVRHLMRLASVSRGTAADALTRLREHPAPLHLLSEPDLTDPEERHQP